MASVVEIFCGTEKSKEMVNQLIAKILKKDPYLAAPCFTISTIADPSLFEEISNVIDFNNPNYFYLDRLPRFYLEGLKLQKGAEERVAACKFLLGNAYNMLSDVRDREANLGLAIRAYSEALRVRTFERFPQDYAMTQHGLGNAYCYLSDVRDREANLGLAIQAYSEALQVLTKDALPWYFVGVCWGMVIALFKKGDIAGALRVMEEMLPVAEDVGHPGLEDFRRFYEELKSSG